MKKLISISQINDKGVEINGEFRLQSLEAGITEDGTLWVKTLTKISELYSGKLSNVKINDTIYANPVEALKALEFLANFKSGGSSPLPTAWGDIVGNIESQSDLVAYIAKVRETALVFDTEEQLNDWIAGTYIRDDRKVVADLIVGNLLLIRAVDVPDYWWDGTNALELEVKLDLSDYAKLSDLENLVTKDELKDFVKDEEGEIDYGNIHQIDNLSFGIVQDMWCDKFGNVYIVDQLGNNVFIKRPGESGTVESIQLSTISTSTASRFQPAKFIKTKDVGNLGGAWLLNAYGFFRIEADGTYSLIFAKSHDAVELADGSAIFAHRNDGYIFRMAAPDYTPFMSGYSQSGYIRLLSTSDNRLLIIGNNKYISPQGGVGSLTAMTLPLTLTTYMNLKVADTTNQTFIYHGRRYNISSYPAYYRRYGGALTTFTNITNPTVAGIAADPTLPDALLMSPVDGSAYISKNGSITTNFPHFYTEDVLKIAENTYYAISYLFDSGIKILKNIGEGATISETNIGVGAFIAMAYNTIENSYYFITKTGELFRTAITDSQMPKVRKFNSETNSWEWVTAYDYLGSKEDVDYILSEIDGENTSKRTIYIDTNSESDIETGSSLHPFKSWDNALPMIQSGGSYTVIIQSGSSLGNVVIDNISNLSIVAGGHVRGQYRSEVENIIISGNSQRVGVSGLQITEYLEVRSTEGNIYFDDVAVKGYTWINTPGYIQFKDGEFMGDTDIDDGNVYMDSVRFEEQVLLSYNASGGALTLVKCENVSVDSYGQNALIAINTNFIQSDNHLAISMHDGTALLIGGTSRMPDGSLASIGLIGTYSLGTFEFEPTTSTLQGTRIDGGLHSIQVYDHEPRQGYMQTDDTIKGHLDGISVALQNLSDRIDNL